MTNCPHKCILFFHDLPCSLSITYTPLLSIVFILFHKMSVFILTCVFVHHLLWSQVLQACGSETVPRILVGNKSDLLVERFFFAFLFYFSSSMVFSLSSTSSFSSCRQVSTEEGQRLATEIGAAFIECSAKHNVCVGKQLPLSFILWKR